jgi:hypothetical protein
MKTITLSQGYVALVDDEDYERVNQFKWCAQVTPRTVYAHRGVKRNGKWTTEKMHKFISRIAPGKCVDVDHEDTDGLNNQKYNLRVSTRKQNTYNQRKKSGVSQSQFKGVTKSGDNWRARIRVNGSLLHLGCFTTEIQAALAYDQAASKHFGQFALPNGAHA